MKLHNAVTSLEARQQQQPPFLHSDAAESSKGRKAYQLTRAGYHVVFFLSPVGTPSTQTTLPNRSSFCR